LEKLSLTDFPDRTLQPPAPDGTLASEVQRSRRLRRAFFRPAADVDRFKQYNDTHVTPRRDAGREDREVFRRTTRQVTVWRATEARIRVMLLEATWHGKRSSPRGSPRVPEQDLGDGNSASIGVASTRRRRDPES